MDESNKGLIWAALSLAAFVAAEVCVYSAQRRVAAERASLEQKVVGLRSRIAEQEKQAADELAKGRSLNAEKEKLVASAAPNHMRILRTLKALETERARYGPSDPLKLNLQYSTVWLGMAANLMDDPDYALKEREISKYETETNFRPLLQKYAARGINADRLATILSDENLDPMEAEAIAKKEGLSVADANSAMEAAARDVQDRLKDLLGTESYANFRTDTGISSGADALQARLSYEATPLDKNQYAALATILGSQSPQFILEGRYDESIAAKAQTILSPDQFRVLEELMRETK